MQLVIYQYFLPTFQFSPIDDISLSLSLSITSISSLSHFHHCAIVPTAVSIFPLLSVLPVLLEILPSGSFVISEESHCKLNGARMRKGKEKGDGNVRHAIRQLIVLLTFPLRRAVRTRGEVSAYIGVILAPLLGLSRREVCVVTV